MLTSRKLFTKEPLLPVQTQNHYLDTTFRAILPVFLSALQFVFINMMPYIHLFPLGSALLGRNIILTHQHSLQLFAKCKGKLSPRGEDPVAQTKQCDRMCESLLILLLWLLPASQDHHPLSPWAQGHRVGVSSSNRHLIWPFGHKSLMANNEHLKGCWDSWRILRMCQAVSGVASSLQARSAPQCSQGYKPAPSLSSGIVSTLYFQVLYQVCSLQDTTLTCCAAHSTNHQRC